MISHSKSSFLTWELNTQAVCQASSGVWGSTAGPQSHQPQPVGTARACCPIWLQPSLVAHHWQRVCAQSHRDKGELQRIAPNQSGQQVKGCVALCFAGMMTNV